MKCSYCKKEIPDSAKVCGYCGTKQLKPSPPKQAAYPASKPKKTTSPAAPPAGKGYPRWLLSAVFAVLVIIAVILVWIFVLNPAPAPVLPVPEAPSGESTPKPSQLKTDKDALSPSVLAGTWTGDASSSEGGFFRVTFRLNINCKIGSNCGTFEIPEWDMSGDVFIIDVEEQKFYYEVANKINGGGEESYEEWLRYINENEIEYYSRGTYGVSNGILNKE